MSCEILPHKQAKLNALANLKKEGLIEEKRLLNPSDLDKFEKFHQAELRGVNKGYGLSLPALYEIKVTETNADYLSKFGKKVTYRVVPIENAFKQIDAKRKQMGIYDAQISLGQHFKNIKDLGTAQERLNADLGVYEYKGEIYPSKEDMDNAISNDQDDFFMPTGAQYNPTNYGSVVFFKRNVLKKLDKRLREVYNKRKNDKSIELKKQTLELENLKTELLKEIDGLENDPDIFEKTLAVFNSDLQFINKLLSNPTLENLDVADYYISYFETISDYSSDNPNNTLVDTSDETKLDPNVTKVLDKLTGHLKKLKTKSNRAKQEYLLEVIDQTPNLKKMFGGSSLEEIKDIVNQYEGDISKVSMLFLSADLNFSKQQELLGQLIVDVLKEAKYKNKAEANGYIQGITDTEVQAKNALKALGFGLSYFEGLPIIGKYLSDVSYDLFYQKTNAGNRTGRLIGKFSHGWFKAFANFSRQNSSAITEAIKEEDSTKLNKALVNKYNWLNENANFIEVQKLPEIQSNTAFSNFSSYFNTAEAASYKQQLIAEIGEHEYKRIVLQQTMLLEDFNQKIAGELGEIMARLGVTSPAELSLDVIDNYNIFVKRHSPFEFIDSHNSDQQGRVSYIKGQTGNQYQSFMNYNTYVPKKEVQRYDPVSGISSTKDSGYYDKNFEQIESNQDLLKFWETASEATEWMNSKIVDSETQLSHNSLLAMSRSLTDVLLNKNIGIAKKAVFIYQQTAETIRNLFTARLSNISADQTDYISKGSIKTIQEPVNQRMKIATMKLSRMLGTTITSSSSIDLTKLNGEAKKLVQEITNKDLSTLLTEYGTSFPVNILREYVTNQVLEEQTFNLPVMLRAYLDAAGSYAAQKESLPKINILKSIYDEKVKHKPVQQENAQIDQAIRDNRTKKGIENRRINSQTRMNHWINKSVKGIEDKTYWIKLGKNYSQGEREFKKEAEKYLAELNEKISQTVDQVEIDTIQAEIDDMKHVLDNIGQYYTAAAIYDSVINRYAIFKGLGFNIKAQMMNRLQGLWSALVHDTGRFWTPGNIYPAQAFVNRKGLRYIPGMSTYKNEVRKAKLLIEKLGVIQDATNELDRAKGNSGLIGVAKKVNPFYLVEYVEWHNQAPEVLAMLMDQYIESPTLIDEQGNKIKVPLFNAETTTVKLQGGGTHTFEYGFPAYNIKDGQLVLKPEFDTEDNKKTWEAFASEEASTVTKKMDITLALINGDYRPDSNVVVKNNPLGRSLMGFKTWMATNFWVRFASKQSNVNLGLKDFDGAYTGSLGSATTSVAGTALIGGSLGVATLAGGLGIIGGLGTLAVVAGYSGVQAYRHRKAVQQDVQALKQITAAIQGIVKKSVGLPLNLVAGKDIIKAHSFNELNSLSETEKQNLKFLVNEATLLLHSLLVLVLTKSLGGDDEEDEPKTIGGNPNPYYYMDKEADEDKGYYILAENLLTELITSGTLFFNASEMYNSVFSAAAVEGWTNKIGKLGESLVDVYVKGKDDTVTKGVYKGSSKIGVKTAEAFLPGIVVEKLFRDETQEDTNLLGFGRYMEKDFKNNQIVDAYFDSDYKLDKREAETARKEFKKQREEYWAKEFQLDSYQGAEKKMIEDYMKKIIEKEALMQNPNPNRALYDESQVKIK